MTYEEIIDIATDGGTDTERFLTLGDVRKLSEEIARELKANAPGEKVAVNIRTMWKVLKIIDFLTDYGMIVLGGGTEQ